MRRRGHLSILAIFSSLVLVVPLVVASAAAEPIPKRKLRLPVKVTHAGPDYNKGKPLPFNAATKQYVRSRARTPQGAEPQAAPQVGDRKKWLALDDFNGFIYLKNYTLRGIGDHIEVWVASGNDKVSQYLRFQDGDCRNGPRTRLTDEQVDYLIDEFDNNMYPIESDAFSVPPDRDGTAPVLGEEFGNWEGEGDNIVALIDNVRDDNFYDFDNTQENTYIAGFFYSVFNEFLDRNIMTVDGFDWSHRTGVNPPNDPDPKDPCTTAPARPFLYEGVFAHEYQHLLEYYEDPDEVNWVNEGLSDWAQTITGYVNPAVGITDQDFDSHIQCFLGYLGIETPANPNPRDGGPENSLTGWQDQGADEILCDYGAAYSMMELLAGRYGEGFMSSLHTDDGSGLASLQTLLDDAAPGTDAVDVLHDWAAMVALDRVLDNGATLQGGTAASFTTPTLNASINWNTSHAYATPGAPPNGSDYVRLRDAGDYVGAPEISSIAFDGAEALEPFPVKWKSDPEGHDGKAALYSGSGPNFDRSIVKRVTVPADDPKLRFDTKYSTEVGWDFGFVQVSTDDGQTYTSLSNRRTTSEHDPGAIPQVVEQLPGFTGKSGGWVRTRFDLSAYAGQEILLSFRYITDPGVDLPGWWIDNVSVGSNSISKGRTVDEWKTVTEISPTPVSNFEVQIISYNENGGGDASIATLPLGAGFEGNVDQAWIDANVSTTADVVAAIVTYDEPTESFNKYALYRLEANGLAQGGGGL